MSPPPDRVVLLGASNLLRGADVVLETARFAVDAPRLEIHAAWGHGRSYGLSESRYLLRKLPGILCCGLWQALSAPPGGPPGGAVHALLTDVGNDLLYDVDAATLAGWVERCLERLGELGARTVVTSPPARALEGLSDRHLLVARRLFFPMATLAPREIRREVSELDRRLRSLAERHGAVWVDQDPAWYGLDPIHIRRRAQPAAWARILAGWGRRIVETAAPPWRRGWRLRWLRPERWTLAGFELRRPQPAGRHGGVPVHLY